MKMKVGTRPDEDLDRVRAARQAIGRDADLFVDANGAYSRKQALAFAEAFADAARERLPHRPRTGRLRGHLRAGPGGDGAPRLEPAGPLAPRARLLRRLP